MTKRQELPMRLALRAEGDKWNAYLASPGAMDGAVWLGAISLRVVKKRPQLKQQFQDLMVNVVGIAIKESVSNLNSWSVMHLKARGLAMPDPIDYRKILIAYLNGVMEAEGVHFYPVEGPTSEEEIAWAEAVMEAGVNEYGRKELEAFILTRRGALR